MRAVISSSAGFQSDMLLIVEQCVAQVREGAGLGSFDAEVDLPRTPPPPLARRLPPPLPQDVANAFVGFAPTVAWEDLAAALPAQMAPRIPRALAATVVAPRKHIPPRRWPLGLCAFVAGMSASAALIASPVGQRPAVRHAVVAAQSEAAHAMASIRSIR